MARAVSAPCSGSPYPCFLTFASFLAPGDWGGIIARCLGIQHPTHCVGVHLNFCVASPPPRTSLRGIWLTVRYLGTLALAPLLLGKNDGDKVKRAKRTIRNECGYQAIQGEPAGRVGCARC